jgi:uncharacterized protein with beta-barrel porin domain
MNRCYKIIFNRSLGLWQVASEQSRGKGKSKSVRMCRAVLLAAIATALSLTLTTTARADDNLLIGVGGNGGTINLGQGGGGGIGGGGGSMDPFGGGGGGGGGIGGGGGGGGIGGGGAGYGGGGMGGVGGSGGSGGGNGGPGLGTGVGGLGGWPGGLGGIGGGGGNGGNGLAVGGGGGGAIGGGGGSGTFVCIISCFGGDGAPVVDGNGVDISGQAGAGAGTGISIGTSSFSMTNSHRTYAFVGVGGGGGGSGNQGSGGSGGNGDLTINNHTQLTITQSLLIGGAGGGGGVGDGFVPNGGGNGGNGSVTIDNAAMSVAETLLVGGSGGGSGTAAGNGGNGGNGTLTMMNNASVSVGGALILGGAQGGLSPVSRGTAASNGGTGTFNLGAGSINFSRGATFTINADSVLNVGNATVNGTTAGEIVGLTGLVNNGTINFNQFDASTFVTAITGAGSVAQNGAGTTILSATNTYTGGTTINGGTLQIGDGGTTGSIAGNVTDNGTLAFDRSDDVTYTDVISGNGNLIKNGAGTLSITGANAYTGNTTVTAGTLKFDTYNQSAASVLGIGTSGIGNYGKLVVTGTATFMAGAKINVDVTSVNTLASGQTLAGIISAGTLNASTFDITDNSALFNFSATVNGNAVDLTTSVAVKASDAVTANGDFSAIGAAHVLDNILMDGGAGDMRNVVTALASLPSQRDVSRAITQTLPLLDGGVTQSTLGMLGSFNSVVQNHLSGVGDGNSSAGGADSAGSVGSLSGVSSGESHADRHVWVKAFGSHANQDDRSSASGFSANSWGSAFGADSELAPGTLLGVSYAYANSSVNGNTALSGTAQHANIDSNILGIYGSVALPRAMQLDFQADIGRNHTDGSRNIEFGGLSRVATSSYATYSAHAGAGLSKDIALTERTTLTPDMRIDYTQLRALGYSETGADALNLNVDANTTRVFVFSTEARLRQALTQHSWLSVNLGAGYDTINDRGDVVSVYAGAPGQSFTATGIDHSPWLINAGIGYTYQADSGTQLVLRYDADGRDGYLNQSASVKASWLF